MANLFTAVDISGLSTNVEAILIGFITVGLYFVARRYIGKAAKMPV